ncbi:MAG: c-type cytochrome, partial [Planctomycetota bacterium]
LRDRKHGRIYRIFNTKNPSRLPEKFGYFPSRMRRGEVNSKPRVLAILLAKSEEPASEKEGAQIFEMIHVEENINDPWIPTAAIIAGARHFSGFLTSALAHQIPAPDAHAEKIRRIVTSVAGHAAREDAGLLLSMLIDSAAEKPSPYFMTIAEAWTQAAEANSTIRIQQKDINHLQSIFPRIEGESKAALVLLLRKAKVTLPAVDAAANEIVSNLRKIAIDPSRGDEARILAFRRIVDLDESAAAFEEAISQIKPPSSPELANAILELVSKSRAPETADALFQHWLSFTPSTRRSAIGVLLRRAAWTESLLSMMEAGTVSRDDFSVEQIQQLSSYPDSQGANANIRTRAAAVLAKKGGVPDADREAIVKKWLPVILKKGDVALGKLTFQKNCMVCHAYSGEGGKAAPDLAGIHNGNREEILISILDPNRSVEANFKPWAVWKSNGELVSGLLASETQTGFELMDAQGKRSVVLRNEVKDIQMQTISFMPTGFEFLKEEELAGLIEMLAQPKASLPRDK